jgi:hypothetical protein
MSLEYAEFNVNYRNIWQIETPVNASKYQYNQGLQTFLVSTK